MAYILTDINILPDGRMTLTEAAKYIGIKPTTLRILKHKNKGPKFIKPGRIYFYKDDIDEWLKNSNSSEK